MHVPVQVGNTRWSQLSSGTYYTSLHDEGILSTESLSHSIPQPFASTYSDIVLASTWHSPAQTPEISSSQADLRILDSLRNRLRSSRRPILSKLGSPATL
ncbi:BQ5605_C001g00724 [Microbotryum silenes-dioicae]|uniref:BQ5605_C001g00724 protein n=1 Tax=Microbotryum silenes-dioicae TaxID=796604 RepID=A0A2X0MYP0_9BASI|nr:BQ5605_C001g00724 [Microbotryum silenes-dioicae]